MTKKLSFVLFILVAGITFWISSRSLFQPQLFHVHDFVHGARIAELTRAARDGHWPVRWSQNLGYGYGMPLFQFYAPLPYYAGGLVYWLTQDLIFSTKLLWLVPNVLSFVGMYLFAARWSGKTGGLLAAVAYTLAPYRAVNLFVRGAIGESWAMMAFPWILWASSRALARPHPANWLAVTVSVTVLLLSHNLLSMIFLPLFGLYVFTEWGVKAYQDRNKFNFWQSVQPLLAVVGATGLAVGLSTFYWLPALLEKNFTQIEDRILTGYFSYTNHFLYIRQFFQENWGYGGSVWGPDDDMSFFLGYGQLGLLLLLLALMTFVVMTKFERMRLLLSRHWKQPFPLSLSTLAITCFVLIGLGGSLFLTLGHSAWIWAGVSPLQVLQFPWRFLAVATFCLALGNGLVMSLIDSFRIKQLLFGVSCVVLFWPAMTYFQPDEFLADSSALYYADPVRISQDMSDVLPDYLPIGFSDRVPPARTAVQVVPQLPLFEYQLEVLADRTHEKLISITTPQPLTLEWAVADFPGWQLYLGTEPVAKTVTPTGIIRQDIPSGTHLASLIWERTLVRQIADGMTVLASVIFLWLSLPYLVTSAKGKR